MCCVRDCLRKWNTEKQVCKDMCMKEVKITAYPFIVDICIFSWSPYFFCLYQGTMLNNTMHIYISMDRCACVNAQEETNMSRTVVLIVMAGL